MLTRIGAFVQINLEARRCLYRRVWDVQNYRLADVGIGVLSAAEAAAVADPGIDAGDSVTVPRVGGGSDLLRKGIEVHGALREGVDVSLAGFEGQDGALLRTAAARPGNGIPV